MAVDYSRLRTVTAGRLIRALKKDGFTLERQVGSHQQYIHSDNRKVTIAFHSTSQLFKPGTLKAIITNQAEWTEDDLKRLKLLK